MTRVGVRLVVAYDGTDFAGFQLQPQVRTVQGELEKAAAVMAGEPVRMRGAGRTDAGVHALGQVVAFSPQRVISARGWRLGLNRTLPRDVQVQAVDSVAPGYDPRFDALAKHYRYLVHLGESLNPLQRGRAWFVGRHAKVDVARMREAAAKLVGRHDFRAFRSADDERPNSVRTLSEVRVHHPHEEDPDLLAIDVHGDAFMKHMVRILSGTLVDVARGRLSMDDLETLLGPEADRTRGGQTAPAHGLTLMSVRLGRKALQAAQAAG